MISTPWFSLRHFQGKTVTFNPGARVDPVVFLWEGAPTVMGFENYYSR